MTDYSNKKVSDLSFSEIREIRSIIDKLPKSVVVLVENEEEDTQLTFEEATEDIIEDWFDIDDSICENLVGKCFVNSDKTEILKVIGLSKGLNRNRKEYEEAYEFIYERFWLCKYGKHEKWEIPDYIWLQETAQYDYTYRCYCLSDMAEMNIASEGMYHIGKDGNLYVDRSCGGDYEAYKEVSEHLFLYAKEEATENGKKKYEYNS